MSDPESWSSHLASFGRLFRRGGLLTAFLALATTVLFQLSSPANHQLVVNAWRAIPYPLRILILAIPTTLVLVLQGALTVLALCFLIGLVCSAPTLVDLIRVRPATWLARELSNFKDVHQGVKASPRGTTTLPEAAKKRT